MFVTITKGNSVRKVSRNQYEKYYKKHGYVIVGTDKTEPTESVENVEIPIQEEKEDLESIPVNEMSKAQLMRFAKKHNIDTRGAKNVSEARRMIQKAMAEARV